MAAEVDSMIMEETKEPHSLSTFEPEHEPHPLIEPQSPAGSDSGSDYSRPRSSQSSRPSSHHVDLPRDEAIAPYRMSSEDFYTTAMPALENRLSNRSYASEPPLEEVHEEEEGHEVHQADEEPPHQLSAEAGSSEASRRESQSVHEVPDDEHTVSTASELESISVAELPSKEDILPHHEDQRVISEQHGDEVSAAPERQELLSVVTAQPEAHSFSHSRSASEATAVAEVHDEPRSHSPVSDLSGSVSPPQTPTRDISPLTPHETRTSAESFASIALSVASLDYDSLPTKQTEDPQETPRVRSTRHLRKPSSMELLGRPWGPSRQDTLFDMSREEPLPSPYTEPNPSFTPHSSTPSVSLTEADGTLLWTESDTPPQSWSGSEPLEVDWSVLDRNEEQEKEDLPEGMEDESTKFLLARLEQENAKFANAGNSSPAVGKTVRRTRSNTRPPSMAQLKKLVTGQDTPTARYSIVPDMTLPDPPPMTELEFWAALVQDYPSTATRLPTLTSTKIRSGIPPPLRGVVWTSMSGARNKALEDAFENLQYEKSPYEGIINKDVGRSFPGVELFRHADGEGQRMLGRVLKCFSLHDKDIGYCQGLGFLVGPLLMNMGERDAFCVLVRLMEHYALRPSFLPSLSGLHMRIFQFSTLLKQHHPDLSEHLTELGVEPAYLSQWFLSCFAVTCPLPLLFRIYDVIFAEGANETVMRVALALFRRNEKKIMESNEFEEVMQLLLGRSLWDCYGFSADDLVDDFTSLGNVITHERLAELEQQFENQSHEAVGQSAGFLPDVQAAASRFLGRLWAPSHLATPSKTGSSLSPQAADKEPTSTPSVFSRGNFLRRSPSKQSIGTVNENDSENTTSSGSASLTSTVPTEVDGYDTTRGSQADLISLKSKAPSVGASQSGMSREQHELHSQIEDLLLALSEAQRDQAQLASMLQREREDRNDDHRAMSQLLNQLQRNGRNLKNNRNSMPAPPRTGPALQPANEVTQLADKRRTLPPRPRPQLTDLPRLQTQPQTNEVDISELIEKVQERLDANARFSASFETKASIRSTLMRTREQLSHAEESLRTLTERAEFAETSLMTFQNESESLRSEVEELRVRVNDEFRTRQKLELQLQNIEIQRKMDARMSIRRERLERTESTGELATLAKLDGSGSPESKLRNGSTGSASSSSSGLRELKLGRRDSSSSVASIRSMKSKRRISTVPIAGSSSPLAEVESVTESSMPEFSFPITVDEPSADVSGSPPVIQAPQAAALPSSTPPQDGPAKSLAVPQFHRTGFARRTSSLAAKEVFATPEHEPVSEDALLLELVNAKTSEAQARQEVDELKRSLNQQRRRADEASAQLRAELEALRNQARQAQEEARQAREDADAARREIFDASVVSTPAASVPATPAVENLISAALSNGSAVDAQETKKSSTSPAVTTPPIAAANAASAAASAVGGWFWGRRAASTTKAALDNSS